MTSAGDSLITRSCCSKGMDLDFEVMAVAVSSGIRKVMQRLCVGAEWAGRAL